MPLRAAAPASADALLDQRVPRAAVGAAPLPLRRLRAALLADEDGLWLASSRRSTLAGRIEARRHMRQQRNGSASRRRLQRSLSRPTSIFSIVAIDLQRAADRRCECRESACRLRVTGTADARARRGGRGSRTGSCRCSTPSRARRASARRSRLASRGSTTSSPGFTSSMSVTSAVSMSMLTAPTIRRALAANQHVAASFEPAIEAVGVPGRNHRERRRTLGAKSRAVADGLAGRERP